MTRTRDWDINELVMKFDPRINNTRRESPSPTNTFKKKTDISYQDIKKAYEVAALVVTKYGEVYLPLFERLQSELEDHQRKQKLVDKAKKIAQKLEGFEPSQP